MDPRYRGHWTPPLSLSDVLVSSMYATRSTCFTFVFRREPECEVLRRIVAMEDTQPEAVVGDSVSDQRDESSNTEPSAFAPGSSVHQSSTATASALLTASSPSSTRKSPER